MKYSILIAIFIGINGTTLAQDCNCNHEIAAGVSVYDGSTVKPGETVCLPAGERGRLRIDGLNGSKTEPVLLVNCGGQVVINGDGGYGIMLSGSRFIKMSGKGSDQYQYGIKVNGGTMGVTLLDFSSDVEIENFHIEKSGFAGIMAKTDPSCANTDLRGFVMRNISFHHNYIHHTGGEGFYVGYSWHPTREVECNGKTVMYYSHAISGIRIFSNIIENTQWDGLQVGCGTSNVKIYDNKIRNYGLADELYQNHGVQIGAGTTGEFFNNLVDTGTGSGISFFGAGNNDLFNNVILNTHGNAIYHNDKGAREGTRYRIYNNTIVSGNGLGINLNAAHTRDNLVLNNLICVPATGIRGGNARWTIDKNMISSNPDYFGFTDHPAKDFHLTQTSVCVDAGADLKYLEFDHDMMKRFAGGGFDVGAYELGAEPYEYVDDVVTDIDGKEGLGQIKVYPNPTGDELFLKLDKRFPAKSISYQIYSLDGRVMLNGETFDLNTPVISTSSLGQGLHYCMLFEGHHLLQTFRFLKN
ncbi:MAG: right-handed parallel beta-helix repeat-containing protein [Cyclobacteriaceae bacterium]